MDFGERVFVGGGGGLDKKFNFLGKCVIMGLSGRGAVGSAWRLGR